MSREFRNVLGCVVTLTVGVSTLLGGCAAVLAEERRLLIHTDDAGLCEAVNEGTREGLEQGIVSSVSMLVVCPAFEEFARYAAEHPEYDYGVHLALTCEARQMRWGPLLKTQVPSLIQRDGTFRQKSAEVAKHAQADDVRRELRAQIQLALDRKIAISHLDHHMWVMLQRPDLLRIYVELGLEFQLPIRLHRTHTPEECGAALQNAAEYAEIIRPVAENGYPLLDFIEADNYNVAPAQKLPYYRSKLRSLKPGLSEFVIHCSVDRPGMVLPSAADRRAADTRAFTSRELQDEIRRLGIRIVSWKDIMQRESQSAKD